MERAVSGCGEQYRDEIRELYAPNKNITDFLLPFYSNEVVMAGSTDVADVTLVVTTDPTPMDTENGDEYQTRYTASGAPTKHKTAMYNYRKLIPANTITIVFNPFNTWKVVGNCF